MDKIYIYSLIKNITPPFVFSAFIKSPLYPTTKRVIERFTKNKYTPRWVTICEGPLKGREMFMDPSGDWQKQMIDGIYDDFFFDYMSKIKLNGKTIYDIGAHVGFSSLFFAKQVGENGKVFTFEPNPFNIERIEIILSHNADFKKVITIIPEAVSNKNEETDFIFTAEVDAGTSSGSFIEQSSTLFEKSSYETGGGFKRMKVSTISIDTFTQTKQFPDLIKIDIEGGEYLALEGAEKTIKTHRPILLIEIHSIFNMYKVTELLHAWNYRIELLKHEKDGRCFISANYSSSI